MSPEHPEKPKNSLLGWLKGAFEQATSAGQPAGPPAPPPAAKAPPPSRHSSSLTLSGADANSRKAAITGALNAAITHSLSPRKPEGNPAVTSTGPTASTEPLSSPEADELESKKRMKVITAYLKNPEGHPLFSDKPAFLKVLTDERAHLHRLIFEKQQQLKTLSVLVAGRSTSLEATEPAPEMLTQKAEMAEIEAQITRFQQRQAQIFQIMKKLTGIKKPTGGTGFLGAPAALGSDEKPPRTSS